MAPNPAIISDHDSFSKYFALFSDTCFILIVKMFLCINLELKYNKMADMAYSNNMVIQNHINVAFSKTKKILIKDTIKKLTTLHRVAVLNIHCPCK